MIKPLIVALLVAGGLSASAIKGYYIHSFRKITLSSEFLAEGAAVGDLNRDGVADIVAGPYWYAGPSYRRRTEFYPAKPFDAVKYSDNFFAHVYDFNRDSWPDILVIGFPGTDASWYQNPGRSGGAWTRHKVFNVVDNEAAAWADVTGDGIPEIICSTGGRYGYVEVNRADPTALWQFHPISLAGKYQRYTHGLGVGDVNGDGRMDLLEQDGWWEQPPSSQRDSTWRKHPTNFGKGGAQMYAYDVDGDGDNDVISVLEAHEYGLAWFEQVKRNGEISFVQHLIMNDRTDENRYGVAFSQAHALELVDMDGDGIKDLVSGKRWWAHGPRGDPEPDSAAVVYWFKTVRGKGGASFVPYRIDDNSGVGVQLIAADVNADGLPDIVSSNKKGSVVMLHQRRKVSRRVWEAAQPRLSSPRQATGPS